LGAKVLGQRKKIVQGIEEFKNKGQNTTVEHVKQEEKKKKKKKKRVIQDQRY